MTRHSSSFNVWIVYADFFMNVTVFVSLAALGATLFGAGVDGDKITNAGACDDHRKILSFFHKDLTHIDNHPNEYGCTSYFHAEEIDLDLVSAIPELLASSSLTAPQERLCSMVLKQVAQRSFKTAEMSLTLMPVSGRVEYDAANQCEINENAPALRDYPYRDQRFRWTDVSRCREGHEKNQRQRCIVLGLDADAPERDSYIDEWVDDVEEELRTQTAQCYEASAKQIVLSLRQACLEVVSDDGRTDMILGAVVPDANKLVVRNRLMRSIEVEPMPIGDGVRLNKVEEKIRRQENRLILKVTSRLPEPIRTGEIE